MNNRPETAQLTPSQQTILDILDSRISVSMVLDVELDQVPFHLVADGDFAVITCNRLSEAVALFKKFKAMARSNNRQLVQFKKALSKVELTLCYRSRRFGFVGPRANQILSRIFNVVTSST